jgi:hypothetical protein
MLLRTILQEKYGQKKRSCDEKIYNNHYLQVFILDHLLRRNKPAWIPHPAIRQILSHLILS